MVCVAWHAPDARTQYLEKTCGVLAENIAVENDRLMRLYVEDCLLRADVAALEKLVADTTLTIDSLAVYLPDG